jgi:hypothetical protein
LRVYNALLGIMKPYTIGARLMITVIVLFVKQGDASGDKMIEVVQLHREEKVLYDSRTTL